MSKTRGLLKNCGQIHRLIDQYAVTTGGGFKAYEKRAHQLRSHPAPPRRTSSGAAAMAVAATQNTAATQGDPATGALGGGSKKQADCRYY